MALPSANCSGRRELPSFSYSLPQPAGSGHRSGVTEEKVTSDLQDLQLHINMKISSVKKFLQLRSIGQEPSFKSVLSKIRHEMILVHDLLDELASEIQQQEKLKNLLKELQKSTERDQKEAQHLCENIPSHLLIPAQSWYIVPDYRTVRPPLAASYCSTVTSEPTAKCAEQAEVAEPKPAKKPTKETRFIKKVSLLTVEEFESIPAYMRGRITYDQINVVIKGINQAVARKYKILHQPLKSMSAPIRNLYDRFMEQETKDTKGEFFFVEADIKDFAQVQVDKRFYNILNILRHCHRMREVRGSKLVRYVLS